MNRLWRQVGWRATSVGLLLAGLAGGVHLGRDHDVRQQLDAGSATNAVQVDVEDMRLLKQRQSEHAAARAWQRQAEGAAAEKAAAEAKIAAAKARTLQTKVIAAKKAAEARKKAKAGGPVPYTGPVPSSCHEYSGSRAIGCTLLLQTGYEIDQFPCLDKLWKKESGWNYRALNRGSGAYGIPQALPGRKMASAGADWKTNPATQIRWGLGYIKGRYDTPCRAWAHSASVGSY